MVLVRRTWVAGLMILAVALTGCSGDDTGANGNSVGGSDVAGSQSGDPSGDGNLGTGDGAQAPGVEGLTVPLVPSADAIATSEAGPLTIVQFIVPLDEQQATISFYDDWTSSQSGDYHRTESESGGVTWQNAPEAGAEKHIIAVLSPLDGDDFVTVTLTVGPAE